MNPGNSLFENCPYKSGKYLQIIVEGVGAGLRARPLPFSIPLLHLNLNLNLNLLTSTF